MSSRQKNLISIIAALAVAALLVLGLGVDVFGWMYEPSESKPSQSSIGTTLVTHVIDGDTITADLGTSTQSVRLIGIDAPEITWPSDENDLEEPEGECLAFAARDYLRQQVDGQTVLLMRDHSQPKYDQYNRLLAYVYLDDEIINQKLLEEGLAPELTVDDDYEMQRNFQEAEATAREEGTGLWSVCE